VNKCPTCGGTLFEALINGDTAFYCPACNYRANSNAQLAADRLSVANQKIADLQTRLAEKDSEILLLNKQNQDIVSRINLTNHQMNVLRHKVGGSVVNTVLASRVIGVVFKYADQSQAGWDDPERCAECLGQRALAAEKKLAVATEDAERLATALVNTAKLFIGDTSISAVLKAHEECAKLYRAEGG
jgi:uncharacterized Zn finger protein (UPF0148 family)